MKKKLIIGISLLLLAIVYVKILSPMFHIHIPCIFNLVTGYECPGCGMTRVVLALLDGNVYQAFRWNMLVFLLIPIYSAYALLSRKEQHAKKSKMIMVTMLSLTVLFFILRNTEIFSWMAPTFVG